MTGDLTWAQLTGEYYLRIATNGRLFAVAISGNGWPGGWTVLYSQIIRANRPRPRCQASSAPAQPAKSSQSTLFQMPMRYVMQAGSRVVVCAL